MSEGELTAQEPIESSLAERTPIRWWPQIAAVLLIVVELGWIVPWYRLLGGLSSPQPPGWVVAVLALVMAAAYVAAFAIEWLRLIPRAKFTVLGILLLVSLAAANAVLLAGPAVSLQDGEMQLDPGFLITVGVVAWLWQRGVGLGSQLVRPSLAWQRFQVGLIALMAHTFIATHQQAPTAGIGAYMLYLASGLMAVTTARISYVSISRSARKNPFDRRWLLSTAGVVALVILIAAAAAGLLTGQLRGLLDALAMGLRWLVIAALFVLGLPALLLSYLLLPLSSLIERWMQGARIEPQEPLLAPGIYPYPIVETAERGPLPVQIQMACFWITLALALLFVFWRVRQNYRMNAVIVPEGPESLLSQGDVQRLVRKTWQELLGSLRRRFQPLPRILAAIRVRQIYADLLALAAECGSPRMPATTPLQFLIELDAVFPGYDTDLQRITAAYLAVRYGEYPQDDQDMPAVEAAWSRIEQAGEARKRARRQAEARKTTAA